MFEIDCIGMNGIYTSNQYKSFLVILDGYWKIWEIYLWNDRRKYRASHDQNINMMQSNENIYIICL